MNLSNTRWRAVSPAKKVLYGMLLVPCLICWALYFYYLVAQNLQNPLPVTGFFVSANCVGMGASSGRLGSGSHTYLETVYEFVSRSADTPTSPLKDRITERVLYDDGMKDCESDQQAALALRAPKTVWAGEDAMSARFRARLTADQQYPSVLLLLVPAAIPAMFFGVRRWMSRVQFRSGGTGFNLDLAMTVAGTLTLCLSGIFYYVMAMEGKASFLLILFLTPFFTIGLLLLYFGVRGLVRAARRVP